jgi:hypothetical protein
MRQCKLSPWILILGAMNNEKTQGRCLDRGQNPRLQEETMTTHEVRCLQRGVTINVSAHAE